MIGSRVLPAKKPTLSLQLQKTNILGTDKGKNHFIAKETTCFSVYRSTKNPSKCVRKKSLPADYAKEADTYVLLHLINRLKLQPDSFTPNLPCPGIIMTDA